MAIGFACFVHGGYRTYRVLTTNDLTFGRNVVLVLGVSLDIADAAKLTPTEYRLHAELMFLPNPTGQSRSTAQKRDQGMRPAKYTVDCGAMGMREVF